MIRRFTASLLLLSATIASAETNTAGPRLEGSSFSEVAVIDAGGSLSDESSSPGVQTYSIEGGKYHFVLDVSQTPTSPRGHTNSLFLQCRSGIQSSSPCCPATASQRQRASASPSVKRCKASPPPPAPASLAQRAGIARTWRTEQPAPSFMR